MVDRFFKIDLGGFNMKRVFVALFSLMFTTSVFSAQDWGTSCGLVNMVRSWQSGSDKYGLRIELSSIYSGCEGGFYIPHGANNKQYVYSTALTALSANLNACIQISYVSQSIDNICRVNAISLARE